MKRSFLPGMRFGALTIVANAGGHPLKSGRIERKVFCRCDCGNETEVWVSCLSTGNTKSCGCLRENVRKTINRKHGQSKSAEYRAWNHMLARCNNPKIERYPHYGGRGIRVSDEWQGPGGFERFYAHIGPRPSLKHSVDRIDVDGHYEPGNVRWATPKMQARNKKGTKIVTLNGVEVSLREACEISEVNYHTVAYWVRSGMTAEDAIKRYASRMTDSPPQS